MRPMMGRLVFDRGRDRRQAFCCCRAITRWQSRRARPTEMMRLAKIACCPACSAPTLSRYLGAQAPPGQAGCAWPPTTAPASTTPRRRRSSAASAASARRRHHGAQPWKRQGLKVRYGRSEPAPRAPRAGQPVQGVPPLPGDEADAPLGTVEVHGRRPPAGGSLSGRKSRAEAETAWRPRIIVAATRGTARWSRGEARFGARALVVSGRARGRGTESSSRQHRRKK